MSISACEFTQDDRKVLAEVYDYKLYEDEVINSIPMGASKEDSLLFIHDYINQWTYQYAILHKAVSNEIKNEREDQLLESQVEEFRNSLIIYGYTKKLIEQRLDTIVDYDEVENYYNDHNKEFALKDDIVQVAFLKFPLQSKNLKQIRNLLKSYTDEDKIKIKSIAEDRATNYFLEENTWILLEDLIKEVPLQTYNKSLYLQNDKYIEMEDSLYTYMLRINNYRIQDNLSPLSFEYDRIVSIIINMRKMELIEKMKHDVFQEAQKNGAIIIPEQ